VTGGTDDVLAQQRHGVDLGIEGLASPVLIGQGGFGAVYRADQETLGRTVAVKILSAPGLDERTRERFARECMAIGALSGHPHIVTVFDSGINGWGRPYIVMDYMARGSVADHVAVHGPVPWPEAVDMTVKLCGAVASAHAVGILHRDIKPQNVLISAYGEPKLGDFGISSIGGEQTNSGSITASLEHAAPELLDATTATAGTDVYALASTLFTMVAGESPFPRGSDEPIQSLIARIISESVPDLRPRGAPGALCDILERALAKSPLDRYGSIEEFADALRNLQEAQGLVPTAIVQTPPAGGFELLDRFAPKGAGTTAPTRARVRNELIPPAPRPQTAPAFWKRPLFIAGVVAALLVGAGAFALTRSDEPQTTPTTAVAEGPAGDQRVDSSGGGDAERTKIRRPDKGKRSRGRGGRTAGGFGSGGGGGSFVTAPGSGSGGSTSSASGGTSTQSGGEGGTAENKQPPPKEDKPQGPPPPETPLYHAYNSNDQHIMTTEKNEADSKKASGWRVEFVGYVYSSSVEGTRALGIGSLHAFSSSSGTTDPQTSRIPLYRMTKNGAFFYTSGDPDFFQARGWSDGGGPYAWVRP